MLNNIIECIKASLFVKILLKIANYISNSFKNSAFYSFFTSNNMVDFANSSKIICFFKKIFGVKIPDTLRKSKIISAVVSLPEYVISTPIRVFSFYLFPSSLALFIKYFGNIHKMCIFAAVMIFAIVLFRFDFTVASFINSSAILKSFCDFFEIKTDYQRNKHTKRIYSLALFTGIVCGATCFLFGDKITLFMFLAFLVVPLLLDSPLLLISLTFISGILLSTLPAVAFSLLTFVVVLCRVIKRKEKLFSIRPVSAFVFLYALVVFYHLFFNYGGMDSSIAAIIQLSLILLFYSAIAVINSKQKFNKLVFSLSTCSVFTSVYGLYQFVFKSNSSGWSDNLVYEGGLERITSTFKNPNVYGEFLIIIICITLVSIFISASKFSKVFFISCLALQLVNLALTYSRGCYVAVALAVFVVVWCCNKKLLWFALPLSPALVYLLPKNMLTRIFSLGDYVNDTSIAYRQHIWTASLEIVKKHWYIGSGVGTTAFTAFYQQYMLPGKSAQHSHNWFLQITIELSVLALILLLLVFVFLLKDVCNVIKTSADTKVKFVTIPLVAALLGLAFEGLFDYIFYNNIIFMCFWLLIALIVCALNVYQKEIVNEKI